MNQPVDVRSRLREALALDLIGPGAGEALADERLPGWVRPSNWYLTGFLAPRGAPAEQRADDDADDDFEPEVAGEAGLGDDSTEDRRAAKKGFFPSSIGLSFLVAEGVGELDVTVRWGDYRHVEDEAGNGDSPNGEPSGAAASAGADADAEAGRDGPSTWWQRAPREEAVRVALPAAGRQRHVVPGSRGLILHAVARPVNAARFADRIPPGTRSASLFLVNERPPAGDRGDEAFAFQAALEVRGSVPFVPRPDPRGGSGDDRDARVADLHYAGTPEYAAGHGVAADWELTAGSCRLLRTAWIPAAEVEKTETVEVPGVELVMSALGGLPDGAAAERALTPLVTGYRAWIDEREAALTGLAGERRATAEELLFLARAAADRIERGIRALAGDADALDAFRVANRAVDKALARRLAREEVAGLPRWRAFQLAFLLLNVPGLADPASPEREFVDLLFFPTGGGKTEAYLGLAAFVMVLRRLRNPQDGGRAGAGVSVIMRLHLAAADARSARARGRPGVRAGTGTARGSRPVRRVAVRDRPVGRQGGHPEPARPTGRRAPGLGAQQGQPVQEQPAGQAGSHPAGELPVVRGAVHAGFLHPAARLQPSHRAAHRLHQLGVRLHGRRAAADRRRGRAAVRRLPAFLIATVDKFASLPWVGESARSSAARTAMTASGSTAPPNLAAGAR